MDGVGKSLYEYYRVQDLRMEKRLVSNSSDAATLPLPLPISRISFDALPRVA